MKLLYDIDNNLVSPTPGESWNFESESGVGRAFIARLPRSHGFLPCVPYSSWLRLSGGSLVLRFGAPLGATSVSREMSDPSLFAKEDVL